MNSEKKKEKELLKKARKERRKKKKNALVVCRDGKEFWTTQNQFWQWVREKTIVKTGHNPLQGAFLKENEEYAVVISNTILNLAYPNHLREALATRKHLAN